MKKEFSKAWKSSTQPRKQRKYSRNAPLHIKHKLLGAALSKELRKKYNRRSIPVKKGDKVKIMVGKFSGQSGTVDRINVKKTTVYITGVELTKRDGSKVSLKIHPSNLMITELNTNDKRRIKGNEIKEEVKKGV